MLEISRGSLNSSKLSWRTGIKEIHIRLLCFLCYRASAHVRTPFILRGHKAKKVGNKLLSVYNVMTGVTLDSGPVSPDHLSVTSPLSRCVDGTTGQRDTVKKMREDEQTEQTFQPLSNGGQKRRGKRQAATQRQKQRGSVGCLCVCERDTHTHI